MSRCRFCCRFGFALAVVLVCSTSLAKAILIETKTGKVGGFVAEDDGAVLKIRIPTTDGEELRSFPHTDIKVIHQLNVKRLEGLSKDNPKAYCDYAEELARHEADPEARYMAMRLYLIAAKLEPTKFGSSSLLRMSALAGTPAEARRYRAMAFLLDPKADAGLLKAEAVKPAQPAKFQAAAMTDFVKALQQYRMGQIKAASDTAKHKGVDQIFRMAPGKIDLKTFLQWCTDATCQSCRADGTVICSNCKGTGVVRNGFKSVRCPTCNGKKALLCPDCGGTHVREPLPDKALRAVLQCELWAMEQQGAGDTAGLKDATDTKSWSAVLQSRQLRPALPLSLETMITGFDPSKCLYRNRKWVEDKAP
jgi:hypothetical protein